MTELLSPNPAGIARAAELLRAGELVAFATETVYGLGGDATNERAVARIFAAKTRPRFNPLICHYEDADAAFVDALPNRAAHLLAEAFWPGPLTLVLPRRPHCEVALLASAGMETLAVRVPAHPHALALLRAVGVPLAAPSANRSGRVSPTWAAHVLEELSGRIAAVLDSGPCPVGVESTVLDLTGEVPELLRPGGLDIAAIEAVIGRVDRGATGPAAGLARPLRAPGMMTSHYAPALPVRLNAVTVAADEALLAFGPALQGAGFVFNLSPTENAEEAAARLFAGLRELDSEARHRGLKRIAVMSVPEEGLGLAINDRLARAAAPRP
jgi:L-threonylcarbamoyladenylate synthase